MRKNMKNGTVEAKLAWVTKIMNVKSVPHVVYKSGLY